MPDGWANSRYWRSTADDRHCGRADYAFAVIMGAARCCGVELRSDPPGPSGTRSVVLNRLGFNGSGGRGCWWSWSPLRSHACLTCEATTSLRLVAIAVHGREGLSSCVRTLQADALQGGSIGLKRSAHVPDPLRRSSSSSFVCLFHCYDAFLRLSMWITMRPARRPGVSPRTPPNPPSPVLRSHHGT